MTEDLKIRSANPTDAAELLSIRQDAIMALAEEYGRVATERWATAAHPDRAAKAIATNSVRVAEFGSKVVGGVELLTHAEREIRDAGVPIAYLDASPNAEALYARRGHGRAGEVQANNSTSPHSSELYGTDLNRL